MKKTLILTGVVAATLLLTGCGKKEPAKPNFNCQQAGVKAPEWTCTPVIGDNIVGLGTAKNNIANDYGMQLEEAEANGRTSIARRLETQVKTLMKNWTRVTGAGASQAYEKNVESVSKQTANQSLRNSRVLKSWKNPKDGTLFVLMGVDKGSTKENFKTSLRNEEALWQQFQSKKAMEELDKEFEKEFK